MISSLMMALAVSCEKGIDPINAVTPGADTSAPVINISYPLEGTLVRVPETVASIVILCSASDDIELKKVVLQMDGADIASFDSFKDYRRAALSYTYDNVTDGDHVLTVVATDLSGKTSTSSVNFKKVAPYNPLPGEVFYMPFDGDNNDLVSMVAAKKVGSPTFGPGKTGQAYQGATDAYLTFPATALTNPEFSATFWYKLNGTPDRAGILAICRPYAVYNDTTRFKGLRVARENNGAKQNLFVNFGISAAEVWMNPFITVTPSDTWMHIAITISATKATIYVDGAVVKEAPMDHAIDWSGCTSMSLMSGKPNFDYWNHFSDLSMMDELRIFNKALSAEEVTSIYQMKK
ncbi:MAG: LamG domain-containing protein [Bacteroidetes bacterium]|nr:LamG domain-containing protein [Bacteroidota bacterium]